MECGKGWVACQGSPSGAGGCSGHGELHGRAQVVVGAIGQGEDAGGMAGGGARDLREGEAGGGGGQDDVHALGVNGRGGGEEDEGGGVRDVEGGGEGDDGGQGHAGIHGGGGVALEGGGG